MNFIDAIGGFFGNLFKGGGNGSSGSEKKSSSKGQSAPVSRATAPRATSAPQHTQVSQGYQSPISRYYNPGSTTGQSSRRSASAPRTFATTRAGFQQADQPKSAMASAEDNRRENAGEDEAIVKKRQKTEQDDQKDNQDHRGLSDVLFDALLTPSFNAVPTTGFSVSDAVNGNAVNKVSPVESMQDAADAMNNAGTSADQENDDIVTSGSLAEERVADNADAAASIKDAWNNYVKDRGISDLSYQDAFNVANNNKNTVWDFITSDQAKGTAIANTYANDRVLFDSSWAEAPTLEQILDSPDTQVAWQGADPDAAWIKEMNQYFADNFGATPVSTEGQNIGIDKDGNYVTYTLSVNKDGSYSMPDGVTPLDSETAASLLNNSSLMAYTDAFDPKAGKKSMMSAKEASMLYDNNRSEIGTGDGFTIKGHSKGSYNPDTIMYADTDYMNKGRENKWGYQGQAAGTQGHLIPQLYQKFGWGYRERPDYEQGYDDEEQEA